MLAFSEISLSFKNERSEKKLPGLERVWEYLEVRGVSRELADRLGLHILQAIDLIAAARRTPNINAADNRAAIVFPHFRLGTGEPIEWWSSRLVSLGAGSDALRLVVSFGDAVPAPRMAKMFCPPNEAPHAYICPPTVYDWGKLQRGDRVYIHESAIKAVNGCALGYASVGLNGVWGWGSKKHGLSLVEELRDIPWKGLQLDPVIVFDSNAHHNSQVQHACARLAAKLHEITGREATSLHVPVRPDGTDRGFDDYVHEEGEDQARVFLDGDGDVVDIGEFRSLMLQLSDEVCVVRELGRIADQRTGDLMTRQTFTDVNYAHFTAEVEDGDVVRRVNVPKLWLSSPDRVEVQSLVYDPGKDRLVAREPGKLPDLNTWRFSGVEPENGDVTPWLELLANNVADEELRHWLLCWCAYPVQNPGCKVNSFILMFGPSGTGKNQFFRPLHRIYGGNAVLVDSDAIKSSFTSLYAQKQFIHADELVRARGEEDSVTQRIKLITTSEKMKVNKKGQPEYEIDNHANLAITSNYWDCVKLDQDDRRAFVLRWEPTPPAEGDSRITDHRGDEPYWIDYVRWCDEQGGAAAVHQYLLNMDLGGFQPMGWAPATPWKEQVKAATMTEVQMWIKDLWDSPDDVLGLASLTKCLFSSKELCVLCYGKGEDDITKAQSMTMSNELRNRGFKQAAQGQPVRQPGGALARWWIVRQRDREWTAEESVRHLRTQK